MMKDFRFLTENLSILLVEDNPDDQALALRAFRKVNRSVEVVVKEDGQAAVDFIDHAVDRLTSRQNPSESGRRLGFIMLDIKLPKVSGLEVLRRIRANPVTRWLPVIMFTSSDEPGDLLEAYELGANSYIHKPLDFNQFTHEMNLLAEYWLRVNCTPDTRPSG